MRATDAQVRRLMEEMSRHGGIGLASARAGMDRKTGRKYWALGEMPSRLIGPRTWRTREDPFTEEDWAEVVDRLSEAPELEAKALFEDLLARRPDRYHEGHVRTFQRRVKQWRAEHGPPREIFFAQEHRPGEAMQTDFTWGSELGVTIEGAAFPHMLCHPVLPYSNWEWVTVCRSESMMSLRRGVQEAVFRLGRVAEFHQTDNSTGATHDLRTGKRGFNEQYLALMRHLGMKPRTIAVGKKEQNGDDEAAHGAFKRRARQHLLLRGSVDFETVASYEDWLQGIAEKANAGRQKRLVEELAVMRPLLVSRLADYSEERVPVSKEGTIRVRENTYSVPARLRGEEVRVRVHDDRLEVYYGGAHQFTTERLLGHHRHRIDYRHVIWSLVRKPGAFARYRYREDLYPTEVFRRVYDRLRDSLETERRADIEYLRILHLAASTMEAEVEVALKGLLDEGLVPSVERVKVLVVPTRPELPEMSVPEVDLMGYDALIESAGEVAR
jgi:hypothetical protein